MASSMLTADGPTSGSTEADLDKALKTALHSCLNDPNFAIVCDFLQKFSKDLGLDVPNFKLLLQWLTKTDEVSTQLRDMQIKLLRKTRKTVHEKSWESALSKFCFTYSAQDAWEIERFGYKNASSKIKLRILRELLECQFEHNSKFRTKILTLSAESMRSKPIGRDRQGHAYWVTQDNDCNIRIYQEHLDEEIWQVVATNREEFVNLLKRLKSSEAVLPCKHISIDDEDTTSSSSQIESDSIRKVSAPEEIENLEDDEQKVPKLSIKIVQGKNGTEITNANDLGKGEEELADEEDAKLLKKSCNSLRSIESDEEEFAEIEEDYGDESGSDYESEDEINDEKNISKKNQIEQNSKKNFKTKNEIKKVKPLLISQNKVINNQNCSTSSNSGKKRALDEDDLHSPVRNENQMDTTQKKIRPSLLDSKHSKSGKKNYSEKLGIESGEESENDDIEVEEDIDEEDIDSVAAEEDENEEKLFEDFDDENEEEEVGEEICDPTIQVIGKGSGNDCDAENYLYTMDYDFDTDNPLILSDIIVEDIRYFSGVGFGVDCLVGNSKYDDTINVDEKSNSEKLKTKDECKTQTEAETERPSTKKCSKTSLQVVEDTDSINLRNASKKSPSNNLDLIDKTNSNEHLNEEEKIYDENSEQIKNKGGEMEKRVYHKEDISQTNGEKQSKITSTAEENEENLPNESKTPEHIALCDTKKSLERDLVESRQNLEDKKLFHTTDDSNMKHSNVSIYNRKRRLTDQQQESTTRTPNSESEVELNSENPEDCSNVKQVVVDESEQDVGGKRIKMRLKQTNIELRKKIEAQKVAASDETTSSSGEEEHRKRKRITSKQSTNSPMLKVGHKFKNFESNKDIIPAENKPKSTELHQQLAPLKQVIQNKPTKIKPTLAEIIEKKLKKPTEKLKSNLTADDIDSNVEEATTAKELFPFPNKSPITKPLKKNLLIQIRQEVIEDVVRRKSTNSEEIKTSASSDIKPFEAAHKSNLDIINSETNIVKQKSTPERQRKRRSSKETVENDNLDEPEAKKDVTIVKENVILQRDKTAESIAQKAIIEVSKNLATQKEPSVHVSNRRSGRHGGVVPTYVDTFQLKRNRGLSKCSTKGVVTVGQKMETKTDQCNSMDVANENNENPKVLRKKNEVKEAEIKRSIGALAAKIEDSNPQASSITKTPLKGIRKQREVDTTNIIDIDSETPVRQSRRIAQQKIREEAERRKLEEIALRSMKQELKKKKKAEKQADPTVVPPTEPSSESEESDIEIKKKVQKKKCPGKNGNWSSGSEEQEEPEEEDEEHHHYETDPGSPLFKSDHEFSPESDIEDESQVVPMKRARTLRKGDAGDEDAAKEDESCQKCKKSDHPEWILLCDTCDKGYHCSCLSPVLFNIPEGDWYCPKCQQEHLIKALENQLKEFDDLVENKKKIDENVKRMAEEEKARLEREEELNKHKIKNDKRMFAKRNVNSSADDSQEENDEEGNRNSDSKLDGEPKNKNRNSSSNCKSTDKRNHRDRRRNTSHNRRNRRDKLENNSDSDSQESSKSNSLSSSSSTYSESDNEPIYKLRKRRQINVSYRLNEYDDLINSALKKEMDEVAGAGNLGRGKDISTIIEADKEEKARQKQIEDGDVVTDQKDSDIIKEPIQDSVNVELHKIIKNDEEEVDSDAEPIIRKLNIKPSLKKKSRKLTTLDISSEDDDGSDEDFKGSSIDDEEEEDTSISASNSDSSLEIYKRHGRFKKKRRKAARKAFRERRRIRRFLVEESDDEEVQRPRTKKKRKDDSDYTESEADDDDISELSENIDSADLCDDTTTDDSDGGWRPNKRKKAKKSTITIAQKSPKHKSSHSKKPRKVEYSDDDVSESEEDEDDDDIEELGSGKGMGKQPRSQPIKHNSSLSKTKGMGKEKPVPKSKKKTSEDESSKSDSEDSTRRTRGRRYAYIEDFDDDSSDGGIKPGVQRPDTPPEEREKFIKRQEEIKRMLAEKNAEGAKLVATPRLTPIKSDADKDKKSPAKAEGDSLSTVPLSVIRQAKVLDIDYLQRRGENLEDLSNDVGEVGDDFDDADLPDDLPEDMDEDAIARMVEEEEEFAVAATRELPPPDEVLRTPSTVKSAAKAKESSGTSSQSPHNSHQLGSLSVSTPTSGLQEPVRKRLPMPTMHPPLLRHQFLIHESIQNTHHQMQRHEGPHTSHLLQNALSAPLTQPLDRNYPSLTSSPHHSLINRIAHSIPLQPTVSHTLSTLRPSHQPPPASINTKSSHLPDQSEKSTNPQNVIASKPRGRRKKITPLRDTLQKQQTAAAVTAANASSSSLASSLVKDNDPASTSLLSSVIKTGLTQKLIMQASGITNIPPTSHSGPSRSGVPMPPIRSPYIRPDDPRFYNAVGNRISQTNTQRHRGPPQLPPNLLTTHPANRSSYGPPPPLKGSNSGHPVSSSPNTSGAIRNPLHHVPSPYMGMPPGPRHASHLNMYSRPPIYGNPNFAPRINLRPPNIHPPDFSSGSRAYPPYGFYPPPPPLTTPVQRPGPVPRPSTQMPPVQSTITHPPASVIVSASSSKSSNSTSVTPQLTPTAISEITDFNSGSKSVVVGQELPMKILSPKSSSPPFVTAEAEKAKKATSSVAEPRKKLTTLQAYSASAAKKSPILLASDSSGSQSPQNPPTEISDESSAPGLSENTPTAEEPSRQEGQASEFSGLVSYFSSQHDDYNT